LGCQLGTIDKEVVAAQALSAIEEGGSSEREALRDISAKLHITDWRIRGTIHSIVFEILKRLNIVDLIINTSLQKGSLDKLKPYLRNLLRIGAFNLKFTDNLPQKVTSTIVQKAKEAYGEGISKFSNALLRKIERLNLSDLITESTDIANLSLKYNHPPWFIEYLINLLGNSGAIEFLQKSLEPDFLYIRVNTLKIDISSVIETLKQEKFVIEEDSNLPDVIRIMEWQYPIIHTSLFKEGLIYIQDKASTLVSYVINPQKGDCIFDLCAAPGGKSLHMGQLMQNTGIVFAIDRSHRRLLELSSKLSKYELQNIYVINAVGEDASKYLRRKADKILIDSPCSGTGTFMSRPYSKWKLQPKELQLLTAIQWKLLNRAVKLLKDSGEIIYSTCSIMIEENEALIKRFLGVHPEFSLVPVSPFIGVPGFLGLSETQRLFPHLHNTEGFFIAKLKRE
jgi:16S rRNA (cytosine967-C5)-methyltransferase